jgi:hypothetical protein
VFAIRVRFFQRQGYGAAAAVSSGAIASTASWIVKPLLFLVAIPFTAGTFQAPSGSGGGHQAAVWIILAVILAAGIAATLISLVPRLRRLASRRIRPHLVNIWANVKAIAAEPRKIVYVLAGSALAQLLVVLCLGASLHAVGQRASIATLITVNHRRRGRAGPGRRRGHRGRPHRRAHQRRHPARSGGRGGAHPAAVHVLPAAGLGLADPDLDARREYV